MMPNPWCLRPPRALLQGSMYIRLKRKKLTVFLHVDPTDTVAQVKAKVADIVQQVRQRSRRRWACAEAEAPA